MQQTSSRELVADYDEELVARTLRALKDKETVALAWQGAGSRAVTYVPDIRAATRARAGRAIGASQELMEWCPGGRTGDDGRTRSLRTVIDSCYSSPRSATCRCTHFTGLVSRTVTALRPASQVSGLSSCDR